MLATESESLNQCAVALDILGLDVIQKFTSLVDEFQQTATRMMIFLVLREVIGEILNASGQQCHLNFRAAGVVRAGLMVAHNILFLLCR